MKKFEYLTKIKLTKKKVLNQQHKIEDILYELGERGWECVEAPDWKNSTDLGIVLIFPCLFKREVTERSYPDNY